MGRAELLTTWTSLKVGFTNTGTNGETVSTFLESLVGVHGQLVLTNGDYFDVEIMRFEQGLGGMAGKLAQRDGYDCTVQWLVVRVVHDGEPVGTDRRIAFDLIEAFNIY